jgi:hypothetical protein
MYPEDESITQILTDVGLVSHADMAQARKQSNSAGKGVM